MEGSHVLVVHSEAAVRQLAAACLEQDRIRVSLAGGEEEGLSLLEQERVHVLVAAVDALGRGEEFVRRAATIQPLLGIVLLADPARLNQAGQRSPHGPIQYLAKPVTREALRSAVARALERQFKRNLLPGAAPATPAAGGNGCAAAAGNAEGVIAASKAMGEILELVRRCAPTDAPVLLCGEPGTGKKLLAGEIHRRSRRAAAPLVRVACGAIREQQLEQALFGRDEPRGPGDHGAAGGLWEQAQGGTLLLDDVAQLPSWAQVALLDMLQQGRSVPGGADVRVIATSTADLAAAVEQGNFASGLYYYLNVVQIHVPPLRYRPQDIRGLAERYLAAANALRSQQKDQPGPCRFSEEAARCLLEYEWPGNMLQLASVVVHAALLSEEEEIGRAALTEAIGRPVTRGVSDTIPVPLLGNLAEIERYIIGEVLHRCRGNKAAAARALGLHRRTLYRMLQDEAPRKPPSAPLPLVLGAGIDQSPAGVCP
jgi:DNA-binding NtrC family response regulator